MLAADTQSHALSVIPRRSIRYTCHALREPYVSTKKKPPNKPTSIDRRSSKKTVIPHPDAGSPTDDIHLMGFTIGDATDKVPPRHCHVPCPAEAKGVGGALSLQTPYSHQPTVIPPCPSTNELGTQQFIGGGTDPGSPTYGIHLMRFTIGDAADKVPPRRR